MKGQRRSRASASTLVAVPHSWGTMPSEQRALSSAASHGTGVVVVVVAVVVVAVVVVVVVVATVVEGPACVLAQ